MAGAAPVDDRAPWLVLGASGQIGYFLLQRLSQRGERVVAVSRHSPPTWADRLPQVGWRSGDLFRDLPALAATRIISAGPLDGLAAWLERAAPPWPERIAAI